MPPFSFLEKYCRKDLLLKKLLCSKAEIIHSIQSIFTYEIWHVLPPFRERAQLFFSQKVFSPLMLKMHSVTFERFSKMTHQRLLCSFSEPSVHQRVRLMKTSLYFTLQDASWKYCLSFTLQQYGMRYQMIKTNPQF